MTKTQPVQYQRIEVTYFGMDYRRFHGHAHARLSKDGVDVRPAEDDTLVGTLFHYKDSTVTLGFIIGGGARLEFIAQGDTRGIAEEFLAELNLKSSYYRIQDAADNPKK